MYSCHVRRTDRFRLEKEKTAFIATRIYPPSARIFPYSTFLSSADYLRRRRRYLMILLESTELRMACGRQNFIYCCNLMAMRTINSRLCAGIIVRFSVAVNGHFEPSLCFLYLRNVSRQSGITKHVHTFSFHHHSSRRATLTERQVTDLRFRL